MAFDKKFEYDEFGRVAEGRQLSGDQLSHWMFNYIDCYACDRRAIDAGGNRPAHQRGDCRRAISIRSARRLPRWFAVGTARNIAAKIHAKSAMAKTWQDALAPAMSSGLTPDAVLATNEPRRQHGGPVARLRQRADEDAGLDRADEQHRQGNPLRRRVPTGVSLAAQSVVQAVDGPINGSGSPIIGGGS